MNEYKNERIFKIGEKHAKNVLLPVRLEPTSNTKIDKKEQKNIRLFLHLYKLMG